MTGSELASTRKALGLSTIQWGRALGYTGTDESVASSVRRLEARHDRVVPGPIGKLAYMIKIDADRDR